MRHASPDALVELADVLESLRGIDGLRESRPGAFSAGGRAFCHFHEDAAGLFVDARFDPAGDFLRREVTTPAQRRRFLAEVRRSMRARG